MPSTAHRTANKASSGVNKEGQRYRESNLNPSFVGLNPPPNKQAPKDLLLSSSSLTPPHHNQAPGESVSATNTDSPSVRSSKRGRGLAKKQHGNSKRRATNDVCPGSAVSASSSNANAAGTPVEDEVCIICVLFVHVNINASTHVESVR